MRKRQSRCLVGGIVACGIQNEIHPSCAMASRVWRAHLPQSKTIRWIFEFNPPLLALVTFVVAALLTPSQ